MVYDSGRLTVTNPPNAESGASLSVTEQGVQATVGAERSVTAAEHLWFLPWVGAGLMLLGGLTLVMRSWFPAVPISASLVSLGFGGLFIFLPTLVEQAWWLIIVLPACVVALYAVGLIDNKKKLLSAITS